MNVVARIMIYFQMMYDSDTFDHKILLLAIMETNSPFWW